MAYLYEDLRGCFICCVSYLTNQPIITALIPISGFTSELVVGCFQIKKFTLFMRVFWEDLYVLTGFNIFVNPFQRPLEHHYSALVQIKMGLVWGNTTISKKSLGTIEKCGFYPFLQGK